MTRLTVVTGPHASTASTTRAYVQLIITVVIWGGYFVVAKKAVDGASPLALAAGRYVLGAMALGLLAARTGLPRINRREALLIAGMGVTSVFGFNVLSFIGLDHAPASDAALVMPTMPTLFVIPLATILFGERLGGWQLGGLGLLLAGELVVFREVLFSGALDGERLMGISLFLGAAFLWAVYTLLARALGGGLSPVHATFYAVAVGTILLLPFGGYPFARELATGDGGFILTIVYLGALQTVVGLVWWYEGIQAIGAAKAAMLNTLVPVVAIALGAVFLDEVPSLERVAGAALVVAGVIVATALRSEPLTTPPE
jgi:drug/metabolite transporter (DMT)-like permease